MFLYDSGGKVDSRKRLDERTSYDRDDIFLRNPWSGEAKYVDPKSISWDDYERMLPYMDEDILDQIDDAHLAGRFDADTAGGWFAKYVELAGVEDASAIYFM